MNKLAFVMAVIGVAFISNVLISDFQKRVLFIIGAWCLIAALKAWGIGK